ncbi:hypothetical protein JCM3770_004116 [Rhodotorula araucariae]
MRASVLLSLVPALLLGQFAGAAPVVRDPRQVTPALQLRRLGPNGEIIVPSSDPFYQPPANWTKLERGAVLNSRPVWTQFDSGAQSVYQVLYKTTTALGEPDATAATLFAPAEPASPPRVMLLLAPIDTAARDCQVTFALENGGESNATEFLQSTVAIDLLASLSKGYYVAVPDHEGSNASFISGVTEALAGLDGLRALLNHNETLPSSANYSAVIHGYSGGGHASAWATSYASTYGKDLNIIAAAYGGVPVDLTSTLALLNGGNSSFLAIGSLVGLANAYPDLNAHYEKILTENGTRAFEIARTMCNTEAAKELAGVDVASLFTSGASFINDTSIQKWLQGGLLGQPLNDSSLTPVNISGVVSIPVFQYHSATDEIVAYKPVPAYVKHQCERGAKIQFQASIGTSHSTTSVAFSGDAYNFLERAFNGTLELNACNQTLGIDAMPGTPEYIQAIGTQAWGLISSMLG